MLLDLTIVIPVKNEERNLAGCLQSIGKDFAKQIVIVDSGSSDRTREIARDYGVGVIDFVWDGKFPKKRNWYLRNHPPDTKWILFLDADEYLTPEFKVEARHALSSENDIVGFWLSYTVYFMGKHLKGGYPLNKLALFKVGAGEYERIDEQQWSKLDMEIHEHPVLSGVIGKIKSRILHQDLRGISHYLSKHNEYAEWEARRFLTLIDGTGNKSLNWKQKLKYKLITSIWIGPLYFFGSFFLLGGFRDGARGLAFAIFKMSYFTQISIRIKEAR